MNEKIIKLINFIQMRYDSTQNDLDNEQPQGSYNSGTYLNTTFRDSLINLNRERKEYIDFLTQLSNEKK